MMSAAARGRVDAGRARRLSGPRSGIGSVGVDWPTGEARGVLPVSGHMAIFELLISASLRRQLARLFDHLTQLLNPLPVLAVFGKGRHHPGEFIQLHRFAERFAIESGGEQ